MNTEIAFLYRDADNNKVHNRVIVAGEVHESQVRKIMENLEDGEFFIPSMVGLPGKQFDEYDPEVDHPWFELHECGFTATKYAPTIPIDISGLVERFEKAGQSGWKQTYI